ncbi:MAG: RIP metalloprotease RseP [Sphingomonadaceae bacterium]|nr:RIP metalloprotease RseP [Sphingomonadaceae bacterium]
MFLVVLGVLVFVHELGHYAAARLLGIRVETFSVGFGRELVGFTDRHGTRWKVGWIPLGGYAKFVGDLDAASRPDPATFALPEAEKRALFAFRPVWQRALVVAAGPAVNFLFAILLFAGFFMTWGHQYTPPVVGEVVPGSPAAAAGLAPGDRLVAVGGRPVDRFEDVVRLVAVSAGRPLELEVERAGRRLVLEALPAAETEIDRFGNRHVKGRLGIRSGPPVVERRGPVEAVVHAVDETVEITRLMGEVLVQVVTGRRPLDELGGPLRIAKASGESAAMGLAAFVTFVALISINLGFANLLPVPMLDGGHLLLYAVEAIRRRPLEPRLQEIAFMMGFVFLVSLMFLLTVNDLASFGLWRDPASPQG